MAKTNKIKILFIQEQRDEINAFEREFATLDEVKTWVLLDKINEYGDVLAYGGRFEGLDVADVADLETLTYEDALNWNELKNLIKE